MTKYMDTQELQRTELNILRLFHNYCEENNLTYYLYAGTLLGAVRHKGFIPWDDDIDVQMPRADYERLYELSQGEAPLPEPLTLRFTRNEQQYSNPFIKIADTRTDGRIDYLRSEIRVPVWIDVFPLDGVPDDPAERDSYLQDLYKRQNLINYVCRRFTPTWNPLKMGWHILEFLIFHFRDYRRIADQIDRDAQKYPYDGGEYIAVAAFDGVKRLFRRSWFAEKVLVDFEGGQFWAPKEWDAVLTYMFQDYMQLPPVEQRTPHHEYQAWWKAENADGGK